MKPENFLEEEEIQIIDADLIESEDEGLNFHEDSKSKREE